LHRFWRRIHGEGGTFSGWETHADPERFEIAANKAGNNALSVMAKQKLQSTGPMGMQPSHHGSTLPFSSQPVAPALVGADAPVTPPAKTRPTRIDAVRIAKARIMRRNSLRKQRQAQKG
jgi:hypothetical protein